MEGALFYCARLARPHPRTTRQQMVANRGHTAGVRRRTRRSRAATSSPWPALWLSSPQGKTKVTPRNWAPGGRRWRWP